MAKRARAEGEAKTAAPGCGYFGVRVDRRAGRFQAGVHAGGKSYNAGRWSTEHEAALARDRLVLHLGLDRPLNFPERARALGAASAAELMRQAVAEHRGRVGRSSFIGLRRAKRGNWLASVVVDGALHDIGSFRDAEALALLRDRVARHLGVPKHSWNFPDRDLEPLGLDEARAALRSLRAPASRYRGVNPNGERWAASITIDYRSHALGTWATEEEAARAHDRALLFHGREQHRNFPAEKLSPASPLALRREARLAPRDFVTSRYRSVSKDPNPQASRPWHAFVTIAGVPRSAGAWPTEKDAAVAADRALRYHVSTTEHDLNFPDEMAKHAPASAEALRKQARAEYKQTTSSQYQGVSFRAGRYDAAIVHQGKRLYLGRFDTEEEAAIERDKKARELHGKNAKLNFPDE